MINILFTKSDLIGSDIIRLVTGEPVSHVALEEDGWVVHMRSSGLVVEPLEIFTRYNEIVHSIRGLELGMSWEDIAVKYWDTRYDHGALVGLGLRLMFPYIVPKKNILNVSGMFLCTELVTAVLGGEPDPMITPHKLYVRLSTGKQGE
jgi:hypothetical protein